jgi:hypothetical protein
MVHRLLRNAGFAPAWIEERKDIDAELEKARVQLTRARLLYGSDRDHDWQRNIVEFRDKVAELNERIKIYNLKTPSAVFQRRLIDADKAIQLVEQEKS